MPSTGAKSGGPGGDPGGNGLGAVEGAIKKSGWNGSYVNDNEYEGGSNIDISNEVGNHIGTLLISNYKEYDNADNTAPSYKQWNLSMTYYDNDENKASAVFEWIQTIWTDSPTDKCPDTESPYTDPPCKKANEVEWDGNKNKSLYCKVSNNILMQKAKKEGASMQYGDSPGRDISNPFYWISETTLMRRAGDAGWQPVMTIQWGVINTSPNFLFMPIRTINPSSYHQGDIDYEKNK
jgi:hypothetical protein